MITALLVVVCLLAVVAFIQFGALIEMFHQLRQVRQHLDMFDTPTPLDLGVSQGLAPSRIGLPIELDLAEHAVVLFLSNKCQGCFEIAGTLGGALPAGLWMVIVPVTGGDAGDFVERYQLTGERVIVDLDEHITNRLGIDITPAALVVRAGRLEQAQTVPSPRQLYTMLPAASARRVLVPKVSKAELGAHD